MGRINGRVFVYSCGVFLLLLASAGGHSHSSVQTREVAPLSPLLSSEGKMQGITLQWSRTYPFKNSVEPKTVVWKSDRLFTGTSRPTSMVLADEVIYFNLSLDDAYFHAVDAGSGKRMACLRLPNTRVSPLAVAGNMVFMGIASERFPQLLIWISQRFAAAVVGKLQTLGHL
jgi:hypothetical protein